MNLLRRIRAAWEFSKIDPYSYDPKWMPSDSEQLSTFMTSETGEKLARMLVNRVSKSAIQATLKTSTQYDSGYAGGCRGTTSFIDSLLIISPPMSESLEKHDEIENQDAHSIDRYRP